MSMECDDPDCSCVEPGVIAELVVRFFKWRDENWRRVVEYDRDSLNFTEEEWRRMRSIPWFSAMYWLALPSLFTNRFFPQIDCALLRSANDLYEATRQARQLWK